MDSPRHKQDIYPELSYTLPAHKHFTHYCLRDPLEIFFWIYDTFDNTFKIKNDFSKYLK